MNTLQTSPRPSQPAPATATRRQLLDWSEVQAWQVGCAVLAVLIGLVMLFYAEENWRGRRAWNQCKKELEAKGQTLDWAAYIPAGVPDDQNFFAAPKMAEWFIGRGGNSLSKSIDFGSFQTFLQQHGNSPVAEVTVLTNHETVAPESAEIILSFGFPSPANSAPPTTPSGTVTPNDEVIPLIVMDEVPLQKAVERLARAAKLKVSYSPPATIYGPNGEHPEVTVRWHDLRARQALQAVLENYNLQLVPNPQTGLALITPRHADRQHNPADSSPDPRLKTLRLSSAQELSTETAIPKDDVIPLIIMDAVPLRDAIKNLARQINLNYEFAPSTGYGPDGRQPEVNLRWTDLTGRQALNKLLDNYNLQMIPNPQTGVARIVAKDSNGRHLQLEPAADAQMTKLLQAAIATITNGIQEAGTMSPQLFTLVASPLHPAKTARVFVRADTMPSIQEITEFFPGPALPYGAFPSSSVHVEYAGSNAFRVFLSPPYVNAADYLAWSSQHAEDLDLIRAALKRPYACIPGDYAYPAQMPIPNFVCVRTVAQTLGARAQCHLLLHQPEAALQELTLMHDLCRLLEGRPNTRPMTLVAAMINTAVSGLYVDMVADGLRMQAWREPELAALQQQLAAINLLPYVSASLETERASVCRTIQTVTSDNFFKTFGQRDRVDGWQRFKDPTYLFYAVAPRGWLYQNTANIARFEQKILDGFGPENQTILPDRVDQSMKAIETTMAHLSPSTFLMTIVVPNYSRALQTTGRNQTLANEALLACALERYHLANGGYPERLDALTPQILEKVPADIIGGQPLKYRPTADGKYVLYSVGWNQRDDGGVPALKKDGSVEVTQGDWVWPYRQRTTR